MSHYTEDVTILHELFELAVTLHHNRTRDHQTQVGDTQKSKRSTITTMATEPMENESTLGLLIVLFLVVVGTIYVFAQQQQQQLGQNGANGVRRGGAGFPGSANGGAQQAANAISTAGLSEQLLRLHRTLPSRNGARTITICADALLKNKSDPAAIAWVGDETPRVLADLLQVADICVLCKLERGDQPTRDRIHSFITAVDVASPTKRPLKAHKILFCTTSVGKVAFVRQLEPQVHVEVDLSVVRDLEKHVPRIVHVVPTLDAAPGPGMHHVTDSFATYFELLGAM